MAAAPPLGVLGVLAISVWGEVRGWSSGGSGNSSSGDEFTGVGGTSNKCLEYFKSVNFKCMRNKNVGKIVISNEIKNFAREQDDNYFF